MTVVLGIIIIAVLILVAGVTGAHSVCDIADWIYEEFIRESER